MDERKINFEAIVNNGLRTALKEELPDDSINVLLGFLGRELRGERTYIFEKNGRGRDDNTYEWTAEGVTAEKDNLQDLPPEVCAGWYEKFTENKNIVIENVEDIKENEPLIYDILTAQDIHSIVVVPLYMNEEAIGFFGVDNPPSGYMRYTEDMLQIMGHFIFCMLQRRNLFKKLEIMSYTDQLTGIGNRHAMNDFIRHSLDGSGTVGVVYCDITGLKRVNDKDGHEAGDRYILNACKCLEEAFGGYGLFRAGGDELLAICPGIEQSALEESIDKLDKSMSKSAVVMAIGSAWRSGGYDIDVLIREAEALMYEDKTLYYKTEGDRRSGFDRRSGIDRRQNGSN